jgi:hypothetical protein
MKVAEQSDWQTKELPSKRTTITLNRSFPLPEIERMRAGLLPQEMEDKWFIYWQDDRLFFHRSWTGFCVYVVRFTNQGDCYRMVEADVNRDPEQYSETNDEHDAAMISYLIDVLLLHQEANFPSAESSPETGALMQWSQVGRAMFGQHPDHE